jgi:hypothetical protein
MSIAWMVSVGGQPYGPYTTAQMQAFSAEGRLIGQSLVARAGEQNFQPFSTIGEFSQLFQSEFQDEPIEASPERAKPARTAEAPQPKFGAQESGDSQAHVVIMTDMRSGSIAAVEQIIADLGPSYQPLPQVWILQSDNKSVNAIKNLLVQKLGKLDKLLVFDATNDKIAYFNFAPEGEARIRRLWAKVPEQPSERRAG